MLLSSSCLLLIEQQLQRSGILQFYAAIPSLVQKYNVTPLGLTMKALPKNLRNFALILRGTLSASSSSLIDIAGVDYIKTIGRFGLNYLFYSSLYNFRLTICFFLSETAPMPSLLMCQIANNCLFPSANWLEREAWDLFGIYFNEHYDLRRILTDYGFSGHPLRKDFPLTGFYELAYNDAEGRLVFEPVELSQELRIFHI